MLYLNCKAIILYPKVSIPVAHRIDKDNCIQSQFCAIFLRTLKIFKSFNIGIKHGFLCVNICWAPREMLKPEPESRMVPMLALLGDVLLRPLSVHIQTSK